MTIEAHKETLDFQAEVRQLLHLMIHSLYSNKEIFLRELISNASDACDKLRFEALMDNALYEGDTDLKIRVTCDKKNRTLTVSDNGIGMSRAEVIDNIGTIAKSGTRQFLESLTGEQAKDATLIGQFGVGFYSSFIAADRVTLTTRRAGLTPEHGVRWESDGTGAYTIETVEKPARGTEVTLHLRETEDEFLDGQRLRAVIRKYSDHISLPIVMPAESKEGVEGKEETVNRASAFWARPKKDVTEAEYHEFYKHIAHDFEDPLAYVHNHVEGKLSYTSLLYVPRRAPFDLLDREQRHGIKLYVRRVFIMDGAQQLMPAYLRFARGVIDSSDLPLNVSRETLQHNRVIDTLRAAAVKRVLGLLEDLAQNDQEKYAVFWKEFGNVFKEGLAEDFGNREQIARLLRFSSTRGESDTQDVALADYVSRMREGQDKLYYLIADSLSAARNSPHLEMFRKKGIEVLLLYDRIDEWLMAHLTEFEGKPLQSIAKGDLNLSAFQDQEERKSLDQAAGELKELIARMRATLGDRVKDVRASHRLTDSPACLVVEEQDMTMGLRKLLKAAGHAVPAVTPILEINPRHLLIARLKHETDARRFSDWVWVLFDQAMLSEGGQLEEPGAFVRRLNELLLLLGEDRPSGS